MKRPTLASILFVALPAIVLAQAATIERQATAKSDTNINAAIFAEFDENACNPGPLPIVRLLTPPTHGNVTMAQVNLHADRKCAGMDVPAWIAIYRSNKGFIGEDSFTVELKNAEGKTQIQKTTVTVK
jgi:hypothetical protein